MIEISLFGYDYALKIEKNLLIVINHKKVKQQNLNIQLLSNDLRICEKVTVGSFQNLKCYDCPD